MLSCRWILVMALMILNTSLGAARASAPGQARPQVEAQEGQGRDQLSIRSIPACRRT
jgi:hypothetical protein